MNSRILPTLTAACPAAAVLTATLPFDTTTRHAERAALTHALRCPTCQPIADDLRRMQAAQTRRLAAEARRETEQEVISVLDQAADVIEGNGFYRHYLWDTRQHNAGTPIDQCRVDIAGALAIALHGSPTYAGTPAVRTIEALLVEQTPAPSLAAWYTHPGIGQKQATALLRDTARVFRGHALRNVA
ncbi:hypothetical protein AB0N17_03180 [Streptomyces sp. NPDC051133]|uniref:DUF6197 family protein n=1 Tax=Streptomyces sp. NPDC051133 TaxID=3155521 RepID=UPI003413082A